MKETSARYATKVIVAQRGVGDFLLSLAAMLVLIALSLFLGPLRLSLGPMDDEDKLLLCDNETPVSPKGHVLSRQGSVSPSKRQASNAGIAWNG